MKGSASGPTGITIPQSTRRSLPSIIIGARKDSKAYQYANSVAGLRLFPVVGLMVPRLVALALGIMHDKMRKVPPAVSHCRLVSHGVW